MGCHLWDLTESDTTESVVLILPFAPKLQYGSLQHYYSSCFYLKFWCLVHHGFFLALIFIFKMLHSSIIYLGC